MLSALYLLFLVIGQGGEVSPASEDPSAGTSGPHPQPGFLSILPDPGPRLGAAQTDRQTGTVRLTPSNSTKNSTYKPSINYVKMCSSIACSYYWNIKL